MMAVRLAVPKLTDQDLDALEHLVENMAERAEVGDIQGFFEANTAFHQRFFEASRNRMLAGLYRQLRGQIDRHRLRSLELRGELWRSVAEHRAILSAARTGDVERAVMLASDHIRVPQLRLLVGDHELAPSDGKAV
jgi:DNA-binding GntR family transcriptional regulator